jgi:hypothetical protein
MGGVPEQKNRYRPSSWESALARVPVAWKFLRLPGVTEPVPGRHQDRTVTREALQAHLAAIDVADTGDVVGSYALVAAWGSGTTNTRILRYMPYALADPMRAAYQLSTSIESVRQDDLVGAYRRFELPGIGQASLTRWFALAGRRAGRDWQPLILDSWARMALDAFGTPVTRLAVGRTSRAVSYMAYIQTLHRWAEEVRQDNPSCRAETLEWLLSQYGRETRKKS